MAIEDRSALGLTGEVVMDGTGGESIVVAVMGNGMAV